MSEWQDISTAPKRGVVKESLTTDDGTLGAAADLRTPAK